MTEKGCRRHEPQGQREEEATRTQTYPGHFGSWKVDGLLLIDLEEKRMTFFSGLSELERPQRQTWC